MGVVYNMDCMDFLAAVPANRYKVAFADPPDNIGLDYGDVGDKLPAAAYYAWLEALILRAMLKVRVLVLSYYHKHDLEVASILREVLRSRHPSWTYHKIIWHFTFGQYNANGLTNCWRPVMILKAPGEELRFDSIRVVSARAAGGDKRAAEDGMCGPSDVWNVPRVTGNSAERRAWHPTQHPEELMRKVLLLCGHPFVDLFGGTGTSVRVGRQLGYSVDCVELSAIYAGRIASENQAELTTHL